MQDSRWATSSGSARNEVSQQLLTPERDTDQFAQTRQPDDLFDDDFTPIAEPISQPVPPQPSRSSYPQQRGHGSNPSSRGRGRGNYSRPTEISKSPAATITTTPKPPTPNATTETPALTNPIPAITTDSVDAPAPLTPTQQNAAPISTSSPVRGYRLNTGGVQKPKLTETELSARLAAARLNNAKREEAHRLAEADEASFQQREAQAKEKRREEGVARRLMEGERERNRLRKLGSRGGREWDEGKAEKEEGGRGGGFRRGMHGGVIGGRGDDAGMRAGTEGEEDERLGGRQMGGFDGGRRGRGRGRGGRGRGRGDFGGDSAGDGPRRGNGARSRQGGGPSSFVETDFPALGGGERSGAGSETKNTEKISILQNADILKSPSGKKGTWADQVEAGVKEANSGS